MNKYSKTELYDATAIYTLQLPISKISVLQLALQHMSELAREECRLCKILQKRPFIGHCCQVAEMSITVSIVVDVCLIVDQLFIS